MEAADRSLLGDPVPVLGNQPPRPHQAHVYPTQHWLFTVCRSGERDRGTRAEEEWVTRQVQRYNGRGVAEGEVLVC